VLPKRGRPPGLLKTSYDKGTAEFNRVTSLSDAVFAIAMTLLVLTLDIPDVTGAGLARALADQLTQFIAFLLSFILVAIIWVQHHSFMAKLGRLEPVLIGLNLALLGVVVAVPYPTNLIGNDPESRVAVIIFISVFIILSLLYLLMSVRAQVVKAWIEPISVPHFFWILASWGSGIMVLVAALVLSFWYPLTGLIILAVSMVFGPLASRLTYME